MFASSYALRDDLDALSPRGGFYDHDVGPPHQDASPNYHHIIQKRGGMGGMGGVYPAGPDGNYRQGSSSSSQNHPGSSSGGDYDYGSYNDYDDGYGQHHDQGRESSATNYLQGYDYNDNDNYNNPYNGNNPRSNDYGDLNSYDPFKYYADTHARGESAYTGYGYRNSYPEENQSEHFYYNK